MQSGLGHRIAKTFIKGAKNAAISSSSFGMTLVRIQEEYIAQKIGGVGKESEEIIFREMKG